MEAHGDERERRLAAGLAHDLNNLLNAFVGYGELLRSALPEDSECASYADGILEASRRGSQLSRQLSILGGRIVARPVAVDLAEVLARAVAAPAGEPALVLAGAPAGRALADPELLVEALGHLAEHARRCLPHGRTLELHAAEDGGWIDLRLGAALPPGFAARMHEPFLPAQPKAKGGLSLAVAMALLRQMGGTVTVVDAPGGSALRLSLPPVPPPAAPDLCLDGLVVVVGVADAALRTALDQALCAAGATALVGEDLEVARGLARVFGGTIHALVSDQPGDPGPLLAAARRVPAGDPAQVLAALAGSAG